MNYKLIIPIIAILALCNIAYAADAEGRVLLYNGQGENDFITMYPEDTYRVCDNVKFNFSSVPVTKVILEIIPRSNTITDSGNCWVTLRNTSTGADLSKGNLLGNSTPMNCTNAIMPKDKYYNFSINIGTYALTSNANINYTFCFERESSTGASEFFMLSTGDGISNLVYGFPNNFYRVYKLDSRIWGYNVSAGGATNTIAVISQSPADYTNFTATSTINFSSQWNFTYSTNCSLYINGTLNKTITGYAPANNTEVNFTIPFPDAKTSKTYKIGCIDNTTAINSSAYTFYLDSQMQIGNLTPASNTQFNYSLITVNLTNGINNFSRTTNCSFYLNGSYSDSALWSAGNNQKVNFTINFPDGNNTIKISCYDNFNTINSSLNYIYIDTVMPTITTNFVSGNYFINTNISGNFSFNDEFALNSFNISIDGLQIAGEWGIGNKTYNYTLNYNATLGNHTLTTRVADGHTSRTLFYDSWSYNTNILFKDELTYYFSKKYNNGYITIKNKDSSIFDEWTTAQGIDRYTFNFKPASKSDTYTFIVNSNFDLYVLNRLDTKYGTWIVGDSHWIDFYPYKVSSYKKLDKHNVEITVSEVSNKLSLLSFESIGDLNVVSSNYSFFVGNYSQSYTSPEIETKLSSFYFYVRYGGNITSATATFYYNDTAYSPVASSNSTDYIFQYDYQLELQAANVTVYPFYWYTTIYGDTANKTYNTSYTNQTVYWMKIDNCTTLTNKTLRFNYLDDITSSAIAENNITATGIFSYYYQDATRYRNSSVVYWTQNNSYSEYCIFPETVSVVSDLNFNFVTTGYGSKSYVTTAVPLSASLTTINVRFLTTATAITFTVVDSFSNPQIGYTVEAWKYSLLTGNYTLSDTQKTDINGVVDMNLYTAGNDEYKMIVKNVNTTVYTSINMRLYSTAYTLRILSSNLTPSFGDNWINQFNCPLTFTRATKNVSVSWNDFFGLGNLYYMEAYQDFNNQSPQLLYVNTTNATSGVNNYTFPNANGTYHYTFSLRWKVDNNKYEICSVNYNNRPDYDLFGKEAVVASILFIGTIAFTSFVMSPEAGLLIVLATMIVFHYIGLLNIFTGTISIVSFAIGFIALLVKLRNR